MKWKVQTELSIWDPRSEISDFPPDSALGEAGLRDVGSQLTPSWQLQELSSAARRFSVTSWLILSERRAVCEWPMFFFFLINQFRWIQLLELESSCVCTVTCFLRDRSYGFVLWALCVIQEIMTCCNVNDSVVCRVVPGYKTINGSCFRFMLWFFLAFPQKVHW